MLLVVEPHFWGENRSPLYLTSLMRELVDRSSADVTPSWLVCPSTHGPHLCCFLCHPGQTIGLSPVGSSNHLVSFGGLVERQLVIRHRCSALVGYWKWGLNKETPMSGGRLPHASSYSPWGSGIVHSPGRKSGPILPHHEAEVSGVGSP